jgi:hypothetical protein
MIQVNHSRQLFVSLLRLPKPIHSIKHTSGNRVPLVTRAS